jgi:hypothetical protein
MKKYLISLILIFIILPINLVPQSKEEIWTAFEDSATGLFGFIDSSGEIKIAPKYIGFMLAPKFSDIIAVMEENNETYYLLKNGKGVGRDSLYIVDNGFDCESEGYIRFKDNRINTVGIFNSEGKVVIPAEYNAISQIRNGLTVGLIGAEKKYFNNDSTDEHWSWTGGTQYLIDKDNKRLVRDFYNYSELDFHSMKIENRSSNNSFEESFLGIDGSYYTFANNEKLFQAWFKNFLLKNLNEKSIRENSYPHIIYWTEDNGWVSRKSVDFLKDNYDLIKERISILNMDSAEYFISIEDFVITPPGLEGKFDKYLDNCGNLKTTQYPLLDVVINHKTKNDSYQDHFEFLKSENGFKLLLVSIINGNLK